MRRAPISIIGLICGVCLIPAPAAAHVVSSAYVFPVPFWMYVYGCAAMLVVTFAVLGYFWNASGEIAQVGAWEIPSGGPAGPLGRWGLHALRFGALASLVATIGTGLVGSDDPTRNISVTLFWVVFVLGFAYLTLLAGNLYALVNPWLLIAQWGHFGDSSARSRLEYPARAGYWPAFACYLALVWLELFVRQTPLVVAIVLLVYTAITWAGTIAFGREVWFRNCDVFSVFFRLLSTLAPVEYVPAADLGQAFTPARTAELKAGARSEPHAWRVRLRLPFVGALTAPAEVTISLILFVLFMLSSTTYDAFHQTLMWVGWFWRPMLSLSEPLWQGDLAKAQRLLENWFQVYQRVGLVASPFVYFGAYVVCLALARLVTGTRSTIAKLAKDFALTLIPIAAAYNMAHYAPALVTEMRRMPWRLSDPLGVGWNLLRLSDMSATAQDLPMGFVWHAQVGLIVAGHLASVYLAHVVAFRTFQRRGRVVVSQLPLLVFMVGLTAVGLWILALPLAG